MNIKRIDGKNGSIDITMSDTELRTITNLLCKARSQMEFDRKEYII